MPGPEPSILADLFAAHAAALALYARQWLNHADAQDAVQELFVRLLSQHAAPANPRAWLYRSMRHLAIDLSRSRQRRLDRERRAATDRPAWFETQPGDLLDAAAVEQALCRLPVDQREIVVLRAWAQMTLADIAAIVALPVSSVHDRYTAALSALRTAMEEKCPTNP